MKKNRDIVQIASILIIGSFIVAVVSIIGAIVIKQNAHKINLMKKFTDDVSATTDYYYIDPVRCAVINISGKECFIVSMRGGFDLYAYKERELIYIGCFSDGDTLYYSSKKGEILATYDRTRHIRCKVKLNDDLSLELLQTAELRDNNSCYINVTSIVRDYAGQKIMSEIEGGSIDTSTLFNSDGESVPVEYYEKMKKGMRELHYDDMVPYTGCAYAF